MQARFRHAADFDVSDLAAFMRCAFKRAADAMGIFQGNRRYTFADFFGPKANVGAVTPLTGLHLPGIQRRPILENDVLVHLAAYIRAIFASTPTRANYGKKVKLLASFSHGKKIRLDVEDVPSGDAAYARRGPCARGHKTTGNMQGGMPFWPIMPSPSPWHDVQPGAVLCYACYQKAVIGARALVWKRLPSAATDAPT